MPAKRPSPVSIRCSPDELAMLDMQRGKAPRGTYIKAVLFSSTKRSRSDVWAEMLALLGRVADALRQIARAVEANAGDFEPTDKAALKEACADLSLIKSMLMRVLRVKEG